MTQNGPMRLSNDVQVAKGFVTEGLSIGGTAFGSGEKDDFSTSVLLISIRPSLFNSYRAPSLATGLVLQVRATAAIRISKDVAGGVDTSLAATSHYPVPADTWDGIFVHDMVAHGGNLGIRTETGNAVLFYRISYI